VFHRTIIALTAAVALGCVPVAPVFGPFGRNQLSIALNSVSH